MPLQLARRGGAPAIALALLISPAAALAQGGKAAVECIDPARAHDRMIFELDPGRQTVTGAFPISWTWFAGSSVVFGHSVQINGHYQTTQSYSLDPETGLLEACDFAGSGDQACGHRHCQLSPEDGRGTLPKNAD